MSRPGPVAASAGRTCLVALVLVCALGGSGVVGAQDPAPGFMTVDEVRAGMRGVGYTVVSGTEPAPFDIEVVGVLRDVFPKLDLVVARLTGLGLERSNVVAGMSGSPVYIDGRLLGAVAYRMAPFGHEAIAGIVPIDAMLRIESFGTGAPGGRAGDPARVRAVLDAAAAALTGDSRVGVPPPLAGYTLSAGAGLSPIATPVAMSGFRPELVRAVTPLFESLGWSPMAGGATGTAEEIDGELVAGGAVAVQLMRGDVNVAATGTITWREGDRLLAFGHPFLQGGGVDFPMTAARVLTVLSSSSDSRKLSVAGDEVVGAIRQDRLPAILGVLGAEPKMIPVRLRIDRAQMPEELGFELVSDPILTPLYLFLGILNAVQGIDQVYGEGSIELDTRIALAGDAPPIRFGNLFSSQNQAVVGVSSTLASIFGFLYGNEFREVAIREVDVTIGMRSDRLSASIARVWHDRSRVRPGDIVRVGVELRPHRRERVVETFEFRVPEGVPEGPLTLLVGDAQSIAREEQSFIQGAFQPRDLGHLVRLLNSQRRGDRLYLQASLPGEGVFVNGEILPSLPPSVLEMLTSRRTRGDVVRVQRTVVAEQVHPVDYVISGSHRIELTVRR